MEFETKCMIPKQRIYYNISRDEWTSNRTYGWVDVRHIESRVLEEEKQTDDRRRGANVRDRIELIWIRTMVCSWCTHTSALSVTYEINDSKIQKLKPRGAPHTYLLPLQPSSRRDVRRSSRRTMPTILIDRSRFVSVKLILNAPKSGDVTGRILIPFRLFSPVHNGCLSKRNLQRYGIVYNISVSFECS